MRQLTRATLLIEDPKRNYQLVSWGDEKRKKEILLKPHTFVYNRQQVHRILILTSWLSVLQQLTSVNTHVKH